MRLAIACVVTAVGLATGAAHAQSGVSWRHAPKIVVVSTDRDPRLPLVDEAVAFWNRALEEVGSGFRLGPVTRIVRPIPEGALQSLSMAVLANPRGPVDVPEGLGDLPGDLTVFLAQSEFVSFAGPFLPGSKRVVGIRPADRLPLSLPNVARNLIAHELGHAIGLGHNADPTKLMCGRPAPCRPDIYHSNEPRMFPLTDDEKRRLLALYPPEWKPQAP